MLRGGGGGSEIIRFLNNRGGVNLRIYQSVRSDSNPEPLGRTYYTNISFRLLPLSYSTYNTAVYGVSYFSRENIFLA